MTEEEAKQKWCPMGGRTVEITDGNLRIGQFSQCLASDCMMWRIKDDGIAIRNVETGDLVIDGYCGLGGKV